MLYISYIYPYVNVITVVSMIYVTEHHFDALMIYVTEHHFAYQDLLYSVK